MENTDISRIDITEIAEEIAVDDAKKNGLSGNSYTILHSDESYQIIPPVSHNLKEGNPLLEPKSVQPGDYLLCSLQNCLLIGPYSFIYLKDATVVGESGCSYNDEHIYNNLRFRVDYEKRNTQIQKVDGTVYRATNHHTANYGHTLTQSLGMMRGFDSANLPPSTVLMGHNFGKPFVDDIYAAAGYWNVMNYNGNTLICDQLIFSCFRDFSQGNFDWIRQKVSARFQNMVAGKPGARRVYLSRKSKRRNILNEDALLQVLKKYGFEVVEPETLSIMQQILLFQQADVIAGPYGAALCNCVFMKPGGTVVELCGPEWEEDGWFHKFSNCARMQYAKVVGISSYQGSVEISNTLKDFIIDPSVLDHVLSNL